MSNVLVFIYDYHMARNIIANICCNFATKVTNARLDGVKVLFKGTYTQGYLTITPNGSDSVKGVIYKIKREDLKNLQKYLDIQYKCDIISVEVDTGKYKQKAITFAPQENLRLMIPDNTYLEKLKVSYKENNLDESILFKALGKTFAMMYPDIKKHYKLIKKGGVHSV